MYHMQNLAKLEKLGELAPEVFEKFMAFDAAAFSGGVIPLKYKELMAIAVALTTQCPYCIQLHADRAKVRWKCARGRESASTAEPPSA